MVIFLLPQSTGMCTKNQEDFIPVNERERVQVLCHVVQIKTAGFQLIKKPISISLRKFLPSRKFLVEYQEISA